MRERHQSLQHLLHYRNLGNAGDGAQTPRKPFCGELRHSLQAEDSVALRPSTCRPTGPHAGFTLVEMMVVIAIIAILTAIVVPSYRVMHYQSQRNSCAANLKAIGQALALFRDDYQCFPPDSQEYLWTEGAAQAYRDLYGQDPPGYSEGSLIAAAYDPDGNPIDTGVHGRGLYTLYYLGIYSEILPPLSLEPPARITLATRERLQLDRQGLNGLDWFRSGGYITNLKLYHCPANRASLNPPDLTRLDALPTLGGWANYDVFYRRNFWRPGTKVLPNVAPDVLEDRHLLQPYPPADAAITWCPHHRTARPPSGPGVAAPVNAGDRDLVLFADGSVRRLPSRADNRMFAEPPGDTGWPAGPIM